MQYLGDFVEDSTVYFGFTTNAGDGGRESFSATLEEADIVIFKDGSAMTLDASTITISNDVGSRVGVHTVSVDMSNDSDFSTGSDYYAVLYASDETLDSQAPAGMLAHWSCENRVSDVSRFSFPDGPIAELGIVEKGTAQSATSTTLVCRAASVDDSVQPGMTLMAHGSTQGHWQSVMIDSVSGDTLTISAWPIATPSGTITYIVMGTPTVSSSVLPPVNVVQISGSSTAANNVEIVYDTDFATNYSTTNDKWQTEADIIAISGDSVAADNLESYCDGTTPQPVNATQVSGDSTAADNLEAAFDGTEYDIGGIDVSELNAIVDDLTNGGRLDLLVDAIKAKTDSLTFTVSNQIDSNMQSINDVAITGDGGSGTEFDV